MSDDTTKSDEQVAESIAYQALNDSTNKFDFATLKVLAYHSIQHGRAEERRNPRWRVYGEDKPSEGAQCVMFSGIICTYREGKWHCGDKVYDANPNNRFIELPND